MLTALATLLLELSLTRILSVVFYYHFAFLAISMALFGLGAGGLFSYTLSAKGKALYRKLGGLAACNGIVVVATLALVLGRVGEMGASDLVLVYLMSALPFFLAGCVLAAVISETAARVDRVYFFDLLGAAAGCILLIPLLDLVGGTNAVIGSGVLFAASAGIWYTLAGSSFGRIAAVALALLLVGVVVLNTKQSIIDIRYAKGEQLGEELYVKWNSFSRVAVSSAEDDAPPRISVNGHAISPLANVDVERLTEEGKRSLLWQGPGLPYLLRPGASALVMDPGGGWDVVRALASGSVEVVVVESNPIIANDVMRKEFADISHQLYFRPEVSVVVGDPRNFVRSARRRFQVIQITYGNRAASAETGALSLAEENLLTTEAFRDYLSRLSPDGVMAFSHRATGPARRSLRIVAMAVAALESSGGREPWRHVAAIRESIEDQGSPGLRDTVLVSRQPLTQTDVVQVRRLVAEPGVEAQYVPGVPGGELFESVLRGDWQNEELRRYPYDVSPVSDDRPYFSYTAEAGAFWDLLRQPWRLREPEYGDPATRLLVRILGVGILATLAVLLAPPLLLGVRAPRGGGDFRFLLYFILVGAGYILVQVALIQKFVLLLGNPTYALTVIVFSMLVSSSVGSFYSQRITAGSDRSLMGMLATAALLLATLAVVISPLVSFGAGWPMPIKVIVVVLMVAPASFVMGVPFPAGLGRLRKRHSHLVKWAWSLNAAGSLLGSAGAMLLTIHLGLRETLLFGGVMYILALMTVELSGENAGDAARPSEA